MNYAERITARLKANGLKKTWIADQLSLRYTEFWEKMNGENGKKFTKEEKQKIDILSGPDSPQKTELIKRARISRDLKRLGKLVTNQGIPENNQNPQIHSKNENLQPTKKPERPQKRA